MADNRWYVIQTYSGQENKVVQYIQEFIDSGDLGEMITGVMSPTQDVVTVKKGKRIKTTRKFFPGYVLVEMDCSKQALHFLRNINGVSGFVGNKPHALKPEEIERIMGKTVATEEESVSDLPFEIGDVLKIKDGPFKGFDGTVDEIQVEKAKVKVMVSVFGRSTPVEVGFSQVEQVS